MAPCRTNYKFKVVCTSTFKNRGNVTREARPQWTWKYFLENVCKIPVDSYPGSLVICSNNYKVRGVNTDGWIAELSETIFSFIQHYQKRMPCHTVRLIQNPEPNTNTSSENQDEVDHGPEEIELEDVSDAESHDSNNTTPTEEEDELQETGDQMRDLRDSVVNKIILKHRTGFVRVRNEIHGLQRTGKWEKIKDRAPYCALLLQDLFC